MKKIKILLITAMFLLVFPIGLSASENLTIDVGEAREAMNSFVDSNANMGDDLWNGFEIVNHENIYDVDLNHCGYVFELSNGVKEGYGIVLKSNGGYFVVEASDDGESPYVNNKDLNVYFTPLEYYGAENFSFYSSERTLRNLSDGTTMSSTDVIRKKYDVNLPSVQPFAVPGESYKYISNYSTKFEKYKQTKNSSCIPASFAMSLKYLHNIGSLTLRSPYTNMTNIENKLYELANCTSMCYASNIKAAVQSFSDSYISGATIRTRDDEFQPDTYISVARDEVDANCPPIIIFYSGALDTNPNSNHATTMVGYKTINNDSTGNVTLKTNYIVVVDPWNKSTKTVLWSSSAVFGYMLIYFY